MPYNWSSKVLYMLNLEVLQTVFLGAIALLSVLNLIVDLTTRAAPIISFDWSRFDDDGDNEGDDDSGFSLEHVREVLKDSASRPCEPTPKDAVLIVKPGTPLAKQLGQE